MQSNKHQELKIELNKKSFADDHAKRLSQMQLSEKYEWQLSPWQVVMMPSNSDGIMTDQERSALLMLKAEAERVDKALASACIAPDEIGGLADPTVSVHDVNTGKRFSIGKNEAGYWPSTELAQMNQAQVDARHKLLRQTPFVGELKAPSFWMNKEGFNKLIGAVVRVNGGSRWAAVEYLSYSGVPFHTSSLGLTPYSASRKQCAALIYHLGPRTMGCLAL